MLLIANVLLAEEKSKQVSESINKGINKSKEVNIKESLIKKQNEATSDSPGVLVQSKTVNTNNNGGGILWQSITVNTDPENDYYEPGNNSSSTNINNGTLVTRGLPAAPNVRIKNSTNKSDAHREPQEVMVASATMQEAIELESQLKKFDLVAKRRKHYKNLNIVISIFRVPEGVAVPETINAVRQENPELWADENQRYSLLGAKSKKSYGQEQIGWTATHKNCSKDVKIGLIDTAIASNHASLSTQAIIQKSFLKTGITSAPKDHATGIASLLVGSESVGEFNGLLPNATLYSAAIFRLRDKNKIDTTAELVIAALDWLVGENVQVVNLSFGGPRNLILELLLSNLIENNYTIISAAGQNGNNGPPLYPAAQPGILAVNAIDANLRIFNKAATGDYIDFSGPGVDVWVANPNGSGKYSSGSSFAAPFLTAAAALLRLEGKSVYQTLKGNAKDLGEPGKDKQYGWGLISLPQTCI